MIIQNILTKLDQIFDYVPILSTITNAVDIVVRKIFLSNENTKVDLIKNNRYFEHLETKRAIGKTALVPIVGNAVIIYYSFHKYEAKVEAFISSLSELLPLTREDKQQMKQEILEGKLYIYDYNQMYQKLEKIPREIGALTELKEILIENCGITTLPEEIGNLVNLEKLDLHNTSIKSLPPSIGKLVKLEEIVIEDTPIESLPSSIENLGNLQALVLRQTDIKSFPMEILKLTQLKLLDLSQSPLSELPKEISLLKELRQLTLYETNITYLPKEVGLLTNLSKLYITNHKHNVPCLMVLPLEFTNLPLNQKDLGFFEDNLPFYGETLRNVYSLLLKIKNGEAVDEKDRNQYLVTALPSFNRKFNSKGIESFVVKNILAQEGVWSDSGFKVIEPIEDQYVKDFKLEYLQYKKEFNKYGLPDKTVVIDGQEIPYHSAVVPVELMEDIARIGSIKGAKAILYVLYCGDNPDSVMLDYWGNDWIKLIGELHKLRKEIPGSPGDFFKFYLTESFKTAFPKMIEQAYGPPDVEIKIGGVLIPVHRAVLKSYCDMFGNNPLSEALSGEYTEGDMIDFDNTGESTFQPFTYDGVALELLRIYRVKEETQKELNDEEWIQTQKHLFPQKQSKEGLNELRLGFQNEEHLERLSTLHMEHIREDFKDKFPKIIEHTYGPTDAKLKIDGKVIPVHRAVLKSYCDMFGENYLSIALSGKYKQGEFIDLDYKGESAFQPLTYDGVALELLRIYQVMEGTQEEFDDEEWVETAQYLFPGNDSKDGLRKLRLGFQDRGHLQRLFNLRLEHILNTQMPTNLSTLARFLAGMYIESPFAELKHICEEAFRVASKKKIRLLGDVEQLMKLVQEEAYVNLKDSSIRKYSNEDIQMYIKHRVENLDESQFDQCYLFMQHYQPFQLGEKGQALFRKKIFENMGKISTQPPTYKKFYGDLRGLIRLLSYVNIETLTDSENGIISNMVQHLSNNLPRLMLDNDENIYLKNWITKDWAELNKKLGTNIPFEIVME